VESGSNGEAEKMDKLSSHKKLKTLADMRIVLTARSGQASKLGGNVRTKWKFTPGWLMLTEFRHRRYGVWSVTLEEIATVICRTFLWIYYSSK
jgi:hypothetical protein